MSKSVRSLFVFCASISACLFIFCAAKTLPYLHPDEHFQIVEFASYKLGITPASGLAWEFKARIRPAFQPFWCYHIFLGLNAAGVTDHYTHLFILRLLTALLTIFSMALFCYSNLSGFTEKHQKWYILFTYCFWVPYFYGTHFASEAWSGDLTLIGFSLLLLWYDGRLGSRSLVFFGSGLFFGLAFLCRFHTAFFAMGIVLWMLLIKKEKFVYVLTILAGVLTVVALGTCIDHWFYGDWVCTPWAYFDSAFIHKRLDFGTSPFYFYILLMLGFLTPPIAILVFVSLAVILLCQPRALYGWVVFLFLLIHSIIPHKEPRFLYPVYFFLPVLTMTAIAYMSERRLLAKWGRPIKIAIWSMLLSFNFLFLLLLVLLSAYIGFDPKIFSYEVHRMAQRGPVDIYYKDGNADPYILPKANIAGDLFPEYLREKNVRDIAVRSFCHLPSHALVAVSKYDAGHDTCYDVLNNGYKIAGRTSPLWLEYLPVKEYCGAAMQDEIDRNIYLLYTFDQK